MPLWALLKPRASLAKAAAAGEGERDVGDLVGLGFRARSLGRDPRMHLVGVRQLHNHSVPQLSRAFHLAQGRVRWREESVGQVKSAKNDMSPHRANIHEKVANR